MTKPSEQRHESGVLRTEYRFPNRIVLNVDARSIELANSAIQHGANNYEACPIVQSTRHLFPPVDFSVWLKRGTLFIFRKDSQETARYDLTEKASRFVSQYDNVLKTRDPNPTRLQFFREQD